MLERAVTIQREVLGPYDEATVAAMHMRALVTWDLGRYEEAEALYRENQMARHAEADTFQARALRSMRTVLGHDHPTTLTGMVGAAMNLANQRRFCGVEPLLREALAAQRRVPGPNHPLVGREAGGRLPGRRRGPIVRRSRAVARPARRHRRP